MTDSDGFHNHLQSSYDSVKGGDPITTETNDLSDIDVVTMGLVSNGANRERFYLLKEDKVDESTVNEELESLAKEGPNSTAWQRLLQIVGLSVQKQVRGPAAVEAAKNALDALGEIPEEELDPDLKKVMQVLTRICETAQQEAMAPQDTSMTPKMPEPQETMKEDTTNITNTTIVVQPVEEHPVQKVILEHALTSTEVHKEDTLADSDTIAAPTTDPTVVEKLSLLEKANTGLREQLEKALVDIEKERFARAREVRIEKARMSYVALPARPEEIVDVMLYLEKSDEGKPYAQWLDGLLKSVDHGLVQAGLFSEVGTSQAQVQVDAITEAQKIAKSEGKPFAEALLSLDTDAQRALINERRGRRDA